MSVKFGKISISAFALVLLIVLVLFGFWTFILNRQSLKTQTVFKSEPQVYYNLNTQTARLDATQTAGQPLPDELIISPGTYLIGSKNYDLTREGLYRFIDPGQENQQRIVFGKDARVLMSSLSWIFAHGNADNNLSYEAALTKAKKEKLIFTCNAAVNFTKKILDEKKIPARQVSGLTTDPFNGYDDSHVLIEVKVDNNWQVFDLDNNNIFKANGKYLNFIQWAELVPSGNYEIEKIAVDPEIALGGYKDKTGNYDYSFYAEENLVTENALRTWYKRVLQIPMVKDAGTSFYFAGEEARVKSFDKKTFKITKDEFMKRFYQ